ncbi:Tyrosine recombinase XerC [subsurface metagenome]
MGISNYPKPFLLGILNYPNSKYMGNCCYPGHGSIYLSKCGSILLSAIDIDKRQQIRLKTADSALFISLNYTRLHYNTAHDTLRTLLKQCEIHTSKGPGPRLHNFRHTFAVHRVLGWYRNGQDVNSLLPALATYMGHVNISSTQVYLQATAELLEEGSNRFLAYFRKNIKNKGGFYEECTSRCLI